MKKANKWEELAFEIGEKAKKAYKKAELEQEAVARRDAKEVKKLEKELERDSKFAEHHLKYLAEVIQREQRRVQRAIDKANEAVEKGESDRQIQHLSEEAARETALADEHIKEVAAKVEKHLERDAEAAATHIAKTLKELGENNLALEKSRIEAENSVSMFIDITLEKAFSETFDE